MHWKKKDHPNAFYVVMAKAYVNAAILRGHMDDPKTMLCRDCGAPAYCYDHRDYWRPMDVDAVCQQCNVLRGPGLHGVSKESQRAEIELFRTRRPDVYAAYEKAARRPVKRMVRA